MIRDFLWNGKKAKLALKILQNPKKEGGLNLVNFTLKEKALKSLSRTVYRTIKMYL